MEGALGTNGELAIPLKGKISTKTKQHIKRFILSLTLMMAGLS
jgi:hypothetical protein